MGLGHEKLDVYRLSIGIEPNRMVAMLGRSGARGYCVKEDCAPYGCSEIDSDSDLDAEKSNPKSVQGTANRCP